MPIAADQPYAALPWWNKPLGPGCSRTSCPPRFMVVRYDTELRRRRGLGRASEPGSVRAGLVGVIEALSLLALYQHRTSQPCAGETSQVKAACSLRGGVEALIASASTCLVGCRSRCRPQLHAWEGIATVVVDRPPSLFAPMLPR